MWTNKESTTSNETNHNEEENDVQEEKWGEQRDLLQNKTAWKKFLANSRSRFYGPLVATERSVQVIQCIYLYYADGHEGIVYNIEAINVQAAFLEWDITIPTFIKFPEGLEELAFVLPGESEE